MPSLARKIIELKIPSLEDENDIIIIKTYDKIVAGDYDNYVSDPNKPRDAMYQLYSNLIQEWNFKDEQGNIYPITLENVRLLPTNVITAIREQTFIGKQMEMDTAKKNS